MKRLLILTLGATVAVTACGTGASDATDTPLPAADSTGAAPAVARPSDPRPVYRDVTIPTGTTLPLALMTSLASDTSVAEDAVRAQLIGPITIDGREILPAGTQLDGNVTEVDDSGRIKGRAMITFRFTSLRTGGAEYGVQAASLSHVAEGTGGADAVKIGIGAGAGAVIGGLLGGKDGAVKGAAVGGGAGTGVVLATKGKEMRLAPGADATTHLTAPLTIRIRVS